MDFLIWTFPFNITNYELCAEYNQLTFEDQDAYVLTYKQLGMHVYVISSVNTNVLALYYRGDVMTGKRFLRYWPILGGSTGHRWIQMAGNAGLDISFDASLDKVLRSFTYCVCEREIPSIFPKYDADECEREK